MKLLKIAAVFALAAIPLFIIGRKRADNGIDNDAIFNHELRVD